MRRHRFQPPVQASLCVNVNRGRPQTALAKALPTGVFGKSAKGLAGTVKFSLHGRQLFEQDLAKHCGKATRLNELVDPVCELLFGVASKWSAAVLPN